MEMGELITLQEDCEGLLIPMGTPVNLPVGTQVYITQSLGDNYTVNVNGNLVMVTGDAVSALGKEIKDKVVYRPLESGEIDEAQLWEILKTCYDPEIPVNIVDLGLIYDMAVNPFEEGVKDKYRIDIQMTLTAPGCGMGPVLAAEIEKKILAVPGIEAVNVVLVFDPPWDQSRMSEVARLELGMY